MIRNTNQEELENMKATGIVRRVDECLTAIRSLRWQAAEKENSLEKQ